MRRFLIVCTFISTTSTHVAVLAADHADAQINVACSGKSGATVAIRWGSPNYDSDPIKFMDRFTVKCDGPGGTPKTKHTLPVRVTAPESTFEVQTEGGIETSYNITTTINSQKPPLINSFTLVHAGSPTTVFTHNGFKLTRSAGPNKYGEQNFRFELTVPPPITAEVKLQSGGDRGDAKVALRWGHPNHDSKGYIKLWKVKPGPSETQQFKITDTKSEFELQTEGGKGTTYSMTVLLDHGQGFNVEDISINHSLNTQPEFSSGVTDITFDPTHGNIYGEGNVKIHAPWISIPTPPSPTFGGLNILFDNGTAPVGTQNSFIDISFTGKLVPGTSPSGSIGNSAINTTLTRQTLNSGLDNKYSDAEKDLQPGSWNVTVSPIANGVLQNPTNCPGIVIQAGSAPLLIIDGINHNCRLQ